MPPTAAVGCEDATEQQEGTLEGHIRTGLNIKLCLSALVPGVPPLKPLRSSNLS